MPHQARSGKKGRHPACGHPPTKSHRRRMHIVLWGFLVAFTCIFGRLIQLYLSPDPRLREENLRHTGEADIHIPRGDIYDREDRLLATDRRVPSLWADPLYVEDPDDLAGHLSALLDLDEDELAARLRKRETAGRARRFVWVKRWLTKQEVESFQDYHTWTNRGVRIKEEPLRFYPGGQLAAHVLGFVNRDREGSEGVELAYDRYLRSVPGKRVSRVDAKRNFIAYLTLQYEPPTGGDDLHLTIDASLQHTLEEQLDMVLDSARAPRAMGVVLDPKTGAIRALACRPAFDPNRYWDFPPERFKNRAAVDVFEPGSAFKIVTAAAAIERGLITPDTLVDCEGGSFNPYGHRVRDFHPLEIEPFSVCYAQSSNIAFIKLAALVGPEGLEDWIGRFGLGQRTCPDFLVESRGIFRPQEEWSRYSMGALPIGQEIAVTALQLTRAFCAIANGGFLVEPYLVERAVSPQGAVTYRHEPAPPKRILSARTATTMRELSHLVVTEGTGGHANIPEYRLGGKTGTAQVARPDGKGFFSDKFTTVFAGFAPISDPRICAVVVVHAPQIKQHYGGTVCGPVVREVVREALIRMNCPEDPVIEPVEANDKLLADADTVVPRLVIEPIEPVEEDMLALWEDLQLVSLEADTGMADPDELRLPDFRGLTKRQAVAAVATLGVSWDVQGSGWVVAQHPPPGTPLTEVSLCRLRFAVQHREAHDDTPSTSSAARM